MFVGQSRELPAMTVQPQATDPKGPRRFSRRFRCETKDEAEREKYAKLNQPMPAPPTGTITGIIDRV